MVYRDIVYETKDGVARILHNRPATRNAENATLLDEMDAALAEASADDGVRVIVIGGTGERSSAA